MGDATQGLKLWAPPAVAGEGGGGESVAAAAARLSAEFSSVQDGVRALQESLAKVGRRDSRDSIYSSTYRAGQIGFGGAGEDDVHVSCFGGSGCVFDSPCASFLFCNRSAEFSRTTKIKILYLFINLVCGGL